MSRMNLPDPVAVTEKPFSRRAHPRVEVLGQLRGQPVTFRTPLLVRDLGEGGFSVESPLPFRVGSQHLFRFTSDRGMVVFVSGRTIHNRLVPVLGQPGTYVAGFQFVFDGPAAERAVEALLGEVTSTLEFPAPRDPEPEL